MRPSVLTLIPATFVLIASGSAHARKAGETCTVAPPAQAKTNFAYPSLASGTWLTAKELAEACTNDNTAITGPVVELCRAIAGSQAALVKGKSVTTLDTVIAADVRKAATKNAGAGVSLLSNLHGSRWGAAMVKDVTVSPIATGVSDFLVTRAEEELTTWLLSTAGKTLCNSAAGGTDMLPQTCTLLESDAVIASTQGSRMLRDAVQDDLLTLPRRLAENAYNTATQDAEKDKYASLAVSARTMELLLANRRPLNAIGSFAASDLPAKLDLSCEPGSARPVSTSLFLLSAGVASGPPTWKVEESEDGWAPKALSGAALAEAKVAYTVGAMIVNANEDKDWPNSCRMSFGSLDSAQSAADQKTINQVTSTIQILPDLIGGIEEIADSTEAVIGAESSERLAAWSRLVGSVADFGLAATGVVEVWGWKDPHGIRADLEHLGEAASALAEQDYAGMASELLTLASDVVKNLQGRPKHQDPTQQALRVLAFGSSLAEAESSDEVQLAVEGFVAPAGGWANKRSGYGIHVGFNGYVGAGGGGIFGSEDTGEQDDLSGGVWPAVMVGPEVSWTLGHRWKKNPSLGLFLPVLDLGPLATVRFEDNGVQSTDKVVLGQLIAPGGALVVGLPWAPLSVYVGGTYSPVLGQTADGELVDGWRVGGGIVVDLVLLP
jgi:hypothetical protein